MAYREERVRTKFSVEELIAMLGKKDSDASICQKLMGDDDGVGGSWEWVVVGSYIGTIILEGREVEKIMEVVIPEWRKSKTEKAQQA